MPILFMVAVEEKLGTLLMNSLTQRKGLSCGGLYKVRPA